MIYKVGRKYVDLARVTAIEPITYMSGSYWDVMSGEVTIGNEFVTGARLDCQLHEKPIEAQFDRMPLTTIDDGTFRTGEQQFEELLQAWKSLNQTKPTHDLTAYNPEP